MLPLMEDYLDRLRTLHGHVEQAIAGLPREALDWVPGPEMNSLAVLVVHLAGSERYWIGDVVGQDPSGRDRAAEFEARGLDEAGLKRLLAEMLAHSRGVLTGLDAGDLEELRFSPMDRQKYRAGWSLAHALEHTALHTGQIQITRQLWDQRQPG